MGVDILFAPRRVKDLTTMYPLSMRVTYLPHRLTTYSVHVWAPIQGHHLAVSKRMNDLNPEQPNYSNRARWNYKNRFFLGVGVDDSFQNDVCRDIHSRPWIMWPGITPRATERQPN